MDPDAADITPAGRQPNRSKKEAESAPLDAQSQIDSIVLNAPVADVYAYCSRFEELPRFITSLRDVQKIDETHFSFTSLLDGEEHTTVLQIVLRIPERRIAWQAMSDNFPRGVVLFEPLSNRTTEITVRLRSSIESATLAKVTRDYLTNFQTRPGRDINAVNAVIAENANNGMSEDVAVHKTTSSFQRYAVRRPPFACDNRRV